MNFVSFVFVPFFFSTECLGKKWNGTEKKKNKTNKQSILEAAHRDNEMVIEASPIWGGTIFGHLNPFISRNRNLLRLARPIVLLLLFLLLLKKTHTSK